VRTEIRSVDRKVEALVASTDPARYVGDELTLVAAYAFHASKLNEPKVRGLVEEAVSRVLGAQVRVTIVLRDEFNTSPGPAVRPAPRSSEAEPAQSRNGAHAAESDDREEPGALPESDDQKRLRAAKAIFNATEV
jgi:hypothetical protein